MPSFKKTIAVGAKKKYWTCKISALQVEYFTRLLKFLVIRMGHPLFAYCLLNTLNDKCISRNCNKCLERWFYCIIGESCDFLHQTFFKAEAQRRAAQQTEWNVLHKTWRHAKEVSIDCNIYRIQSSHSNQSCFPQRYDSAYASLCCQSRTQWGYNLPSFIFTLNSQIIMN